MVGSFDGLSGPRINLQPRLAGEQDDFSLVDQAKAFRLQVAERSLSANRGGALGGALLQINDRFRGADA